jgi:predicted TPR repeat methyltransferase
MAMLIPTSRPSPSGQLFAEAMRLHESGDNEGARALCRKIEAADSRFGGAHYLLGLIALMEERYSEALRRFDKAIAITPGVPALHHQRARARKGMKRWKPAIADFDAALALAPNFAEAWILRGDCWRELKKPSEAADSYLQALEHGSDSAALQFTTAELLRESGRKAEAARHYRQALTLDPEDKFGTGLALSALEGSIVPAEAPQAHIRALFDHFAERFDKTLRGELAYRGPEIIKAAVETLGAKDLSILDLGCGTGLCGEILRPFARRLDGVDLSSRMIEKAAERGLYESLCAEDAVEYLRANQAKYDLIAAGDVLVYFGDLMPVLSAAFVSLKPGGRFIFTVEKSEGEAYRLGTTQRFAHSSPYIEETAQTAGFTLLSLFAVSTRQEAGAPVPGSLVILEKKQTELASV